MDFTLVEKIIQGEYTYKLFRSNFYTGYYMILSQSKDDLYCSSIRASWEKAMELFNQIAHTETPPFVLADILIDYSKQTLTA